MGIKQFPPPKSAIKPERGAMVRLLRDVTTRGGTTFREGVVMKIGSTDRMYYLSCRVRGTYHAVHLHKKYAHWDFVVIKAAPKEEEVIEESPQEEENED